jgi:hypothetical protein
MHRTGVDPSPSLLGWSTVCLRGWAQILLWFSDKFFAATLTAESVGHPGMDGPVLGLGGVNVHAADWVAVLRCYAVAWGLRGPGDVLFRMLGKFFQAMRTTEVIGFTRVLQMMWRLVWLDLHATDRILDSMRGR